MCILSTAKPPHGISVPCPALAVSCPQEQKELVTESSSLPALSGKKLSRCWPHGVNMCFSFLSGRTVQHLAALLWAKSILFILVWVTWGGGCWISGE